MVEHELLATEPNISDDTPYFFQRIGELAFEAQHAGAEAPKTARRRQRECIATAAHHGVVAAAGDDAIYVAKIHDLVSASVKGADEEAIAVANSSEICAAHIDACYASVHISSDGLLLAVCEDSRIRTWAVRNLLTGKNKHLCEWTLSDGELVKQFSWRPGQASAEPAEAFVVTDTGRLLNGTLGGQLASDREGHSETVSCAAWSPDGSLLAFASGSRVIVAAADGSGYFRATAKLWEAEEDGLRVAISTMTWAGADALVLACSLYSDENADLEESCTVCMLHWSSWQPGSRQDPTGQELVAMSEVNADPVGQPAGHYHQSLVSPWGIVVAAHGKANDNHILVLEALPSQPPKLLEILDDSLAIRIPLAADYTDNFVNGLGIVLTSTEEVHHPNPEHGKLPPQPILVVATSDGALRLFTFASMKRSAGSITHAANSYDGAPDPVLLQAAAEQQKSADTGTTARTLEQQQSSDNALATNDSAAVSEQESTASPLPQNALSEEVPYYHSEAPSQLPVDQPGLDFSQAEAEKGEELARRTAAATALPNSDSEYDEEDSRESSAASSSEESAREYARPAPPAELPQNQPQLASVAQAAGRAAATALPDSDEEAEEDLESQASASIAPPVPPRAWAPAQGFGQGIRGAAPSEAAESAAPDRRLGRLDSLSASDSESVEVQSRPGNVEAPAPPSAKEAKPAAMPWSLGNSATVFSQVTLPSISSSAPAEAATRPASSLFGTTAPSFLQAPNASKAEVAFPAPGLGFPMARQRSGALPAPACGQQPPISPARQASGSLPPFSPSLSKPAQAPQVPRQSAAQQAIARAREEALAAKAGKPVAVTSALGPPGRPTEATRVAQAEPSAPTARLQDEGKELASMEREFLKSLAETRALEVKVMAEMKAADGADSSNPGTRKGALALQRQVQKLADRAGDLSTQLASDRARFSALHRGWKDDRARAEALLFFNGKRDFLDEDEAVYASEDVDPVIQGLVASVQEQLPLLQKQAAQLSDGIEALKARAQQGNQGGPLAVQQLYNALNLQKEVAHAQVARVQKLWDKMQELGLAELEASRFDTLQQLQSPGMPAETKEASRSPYVRVSRSPWSQTKGAGSLLLLPGSSNAVANRSSWAGDSAAAMRALLLEKVASQNGGIRLTKLQQGSKSGRAPAPRVAGNRSGQPKDGVPTLSSLQLHGDSGRHPRTDASSRQHGKQPRPQGSDFQGQARADGPHRRPSIVPEPKDASARPDFADAPSSAKPVSERERQATPPSPPLDTAAKASRLHDHQGSSAPSPGAAPGAAQSGKPGFVMPGNAPPSASKTTPDTPDRRNRPKQVSIQSSQPAAKMPPIPSKAALAAAQARSVAALSSMNTSAKQAGPVSQSTAAKPAEATAQSAGAAPQRKAAAMPPVPSRAAVAAAQAQGQAMLAGQTGKPASAKMPPVPSKAALAAAEAKGQAALNANKQKPAKEEVSSAPQMSFLSAGFGAATSSGQAAPLSFSLAPSASPAAPLFGAAFSSAPFAPLSFGATASGTPPSFQLTSSSVAPPSGGAFSFSSASATSATATPARMASAMSLQQPPASSAPSQSAPLAFPGLSAGVSLQTVSGSSAAPPAAVSMSEVSKPAETLAAGFGVFGGLGQQASAMSAPAASPFGKGLSFGLSAAPAAGTVGAPSFSMTPSMAPSGAQSTPFGGALAAPSPASPFPAFGQPTTASPAAPSAFGGFGQGASAATPGSSLFGQSTSASANAPSPFGGFGAPAGFGQSSSQSGPSQSFGGFGQAASIAPGIGNPATPGFGQAASPAFGAPAMPGFGSPGAAAFGVPTSPAAPFGAPVSGSAFGSGFAAAANQSGGFGSLAQGSPNAFGAAAQQSPGGFGGFGGGQPQSGGFGAFGGAAAPSAPKSPSPQSGSMWAPRK